MVPVQNPSSVTTTTTKLLALLQGTTWHHTESSLCCFAHKVKGAEWIESVWKAMTDMKSIDVPALHTVEP